MTHKVSDLSITINIPQNTKIDEIHERLCNMVGDSKFNQVVGPALHSIVNDSSVLAHYATNRDIDQRIVAIAKVLPYMAEDIQWLFNQAYVLVGWSLETCIAECGTDVAKYRALALTLLVVQYTPTAAKYTAFML